MNNLNMVVQAIIWNSKEPISGWDITNQIKEKTGNQHQQVYRELAKLAKRDDVIVGVVEQDGRPDKKVYSFKSKEGFVAVTGNESDYRKTALGYELLIRDILDGTNNYDEYVKVMTEAESNFLKDKGIY